MTSRDEQILESVKRRPGEWREVQTAYVNATGRRLSDLATVSALVRLRKLGLVCIEPRIRQAPAYRATAS